MSEYSSREPAGRDPLDTAEMGASADDKRGREAEAPTAIPPRGWLDVCSRARRRFVDKAIPLLSAGVAFYAFISVVPALAATIGLYGLFTDTAVAASHLDRLSTVVPPEAMPILREQIHRLIENNTAAGWSAVLGLMFGLYGSSRATRALTQGLNIAYDEHESRSFVRVIMVSIVLTVVGIVGMLLAIALIAVAPTLVALLDLPGELQTLALWLRWPLLLGLFLLGLAGLYRFAPQRERPQWRWVSVGAIVAAFGWAAGSAAFSFFVSTFGNYDRTYGSLGAIVVFMLWLHLSALAILFGGAINAEVERQTRRDSTDGEPEPMGERGAYAADTLGRKRK